MSKHASYSEVETFNRELTIMVERKLVGQPLTEDQERKYKIISLMIAAYNRLLDFDISKLTLQDINNLENKVTNTRKKKVKLTPVQTDEEKEAVRKSIQKQLAHYQTIRMSKWIKVKEDEDYEIELSDANLLEQ